MFLDFLWIGCMGTLNVILCGPYFRGFTVDVLVYAVQFAVARLTVIVGLYFMWRFVCIMRLWGVCYIF